MVWMFFFVLAPVLAACLTVFYVTAIELRRH
jgi:hypothetical protein